MWREAQDLVCLKAGLTSSVVVLDLSIFYIWHRSRCSWTLLHCILWSSNHLITMTASPLHWCCCGGSKFTRVTTDAIGIVYSCLVSNVTYISIGLVLSCTLFLIDTFISKVLVLSCTVYLINTVSYLSLVLSCTLYLVCTVKTAITNKHSIVIQSNSIRYQQNK